MSNGKGKDKKVGDWVHLYANNAYQIRDVAEVFKQNRYATPEEIEAAKKIDKQFKPIPPEGA